jgi:hypothetical protein
MALIENIISMLRLVWLLCEQWGNLTDITDLWPSRVGALSDINVVLQKKTIQWMWHVCLINVYWLQNSLLQGLRPKMAWSLAQLLGAYWWGKRGGGQGEKMSSVTGPGESITDMSIQYVAMSELSREYCERRLYFTRWGRCCPQIQFYSAMTCHNTQPCSMISPLFACLLSQSAVI